MQLECVGEHGELIDIEALKKQFRETGVYVAVPQKMILLLHLLLRGMAAKQLDPQSHLERAEKMLEILEAGYPSEPTERTAVRLGKMPRLMVPSDLM